MLERVYKIHNGSNAKYLMSKTDDYVTWIIKAYRMPVTNFLVLNEIVKTITTIVKLYCSLSIWFHLFDDSGDDDQYNQFIVSRVFKSFLNILWS